MLEARAFEPDFLKHLERLALGIKRARTARLGQRTLGRVQGIGIELENFKNYTEGDDLRFLDWNALARLDDLLIRTYRATRQVEVSVLIDASASMGAPRDDDKLGLALLLGAALAYIAMGENDAVRLITFAMKRGTMKLDRTPFHHRRETYVELRPFVATVKADGSTRLGAVVDQLMLERRPRGLVILISDFLVNTLDYEDAVRRLAAVGNEVKAIHVMGERESAGDFATGLLRVRDSETGATREISIGPDAIVRYRRRVEDLSARLNDFCVRHSVAYVRAFGASNAEQIIMSEFPRLGLVV